MFIFFYDFFRVYMLYSFIIILIVFDIVFIFYRYMKFIIWINKTILIVFVNSNKIFAHILNHWTFRSLSIIFILIFISYIIRFIINIFFHKNIFKFILIDIFELFYKNLIILIIDFRRIFMILSKSVLWTQLIRLQRIIATRMSIEYFW
jgi:hypothetical protein